LVNSIPDSRTALATFVASSNTGGRRPKSLQTIARLFPYRLKTNKSINTTVSSATYADLYFRGWSTKNTQVTIELFGHNIRKIEKTNSTLWFYEFLFSKP